MTAPTDPPHLASAAPLVVVPLATRRDTRRAARSLVPLLQGGDLILLDGALGAGKTFFVRALCRAMGLPATQPVQSPTFALVHPLPTTPPLAHADLYRLEDPRELDALGLDELRDEGHILLIEWGARYAERLGGDCLLLKFLGPPRQLTVAGWGPRGGALADGLAARLASAGEVPRGC